ncbi:cht-3 [Pristionchus pacificus]|uniref:Cht-3 n=1 Tax=Pristionchus pacificus TaxID=54126 RepID=A0A2A6BHP4_PRIPA|nr:cht-3 [Pristionchus pacificus]|eukprot:PDM65409.1 cht-3 [Pristionchus pacificus]
MKPLWSIVLLLLAVVAGSRADPTTTTTGPTTLATTTEAPESAQDPLKGSCALYCFITPEKTERVDFSLYANLTSCTHFVYGMGEMTSGFQYKGPSTQDEPTHSYPGNLHFLRKLKRTNPNATILLGLHLNQRDSFISSPPTRVKLASSLILTARDLTVHGLFLRVDRPFIDNPRFEFFFKDLHSANNSLPVTLAVPLPLVVSSYTHILDAAPYVKTVYLMSTPTMNRLAQLDPLLPSSATPPEQTISYNANILVDKGIPMRKIVVGLTTGAVVYRNYLVDSLRGEAEGELDSLQETCGTIGEKILDTATATEMVKNTHTHRIVFSNAPIEASLGKKGECGLDGGKFPALRMAAENMQCVDDVGHVRSCTRLCYINSPHQLHQLHPAACSHIVVEATLSASNLWPLIFMLGEVKLSEDGAATARWIRGWHVPRKPKLVISLGPRATSDIWRIVTSLQYYRQSVIRQLQALMTEWRASGVEISWTLGQLDLPSDATNLEQLVGEMRKAVGTNTTVALAVSHLSTVSKRYASMTTLNKTVDFVVLHSHRFHSTRQPFTGHHSPLFAKSEILPDTRNTVEGMVAEWHATLKMKRSQIIMGITAEPLSMNLHGNDRADASPPFGMGATPSFSMPLLRSEDGDKRAVNGKRVCELERDGASRTEFIESIGVPFLVNGAQFVAYENERSVAMKTTWASLNQLGGIALFEVQLDNPEGECPKQPFNLLNTIIRTQVCETCVREDDVLPCNSPFTTSCSYRLPTHNEKRPMPASRIPFESCTQVVIEEVLLNQNGQRIPTVTTMLARTLNFRDDTAREAMVKLTSEQPHMGMKRTIVSVRCDMTNFWFKQLLRNKVESLVLDVWAASLGRSRKPRRTRHYQCTPPGVGAFDSLVRSMRKHLIDSTPYMKCHHTLSLRLPIYTRNLTEKYDVSTLNTVQHVVLEPFSDPPRDVVTHVNSPLFPSNGHDNDIDFTSNLTEIGVAATNPRVIGQAQVCALLKPRLNVTIEPTMQWDRIAAYALTEKREWMSMQNQQTIAYKYPTVLQIFYAVREQLGGVGLLSLNEDDWEGRCGSGEFPLLTAARARCLAGV